MTATFLLRSVAITAAMALLSSCSTGPTQRDVDRLSQLMDGLDQAMAEAKAEAARSAAAEFAQLRLPVTDHLSAVQYCAFQLRSIGAAPELLNQARARSGFGPAEPPVAPAVIDAIDFGALFPTLRDPPLFDRKLAGRRVYADNAVGACTLLTFDEPGAAERTRAWLASPASGWVERRGRRRAPWRVYAVRDPTLLQDTLVIFEALVPEPARAQGVSAVHVVAMAGLP
jgi:hypothetical protein